jgi:hypothetical protein
VKVSIAFSSNFPSGNVILPTEELIRGYFQAYARLVDVCLKFYHCHEVSLDIWMFVVFA